MTHENKLNKKQKEAVYLLSIGTFLEYFDLMLYVHMAVLLNEIFFPQTDPLKLAKINVLFSGVSLLFVPYLFKVTNNCYG